MIWNRERRAIREGRKEEKGREKCCNRIIVSKIKTEKQKKEYIYIFKDFILQIYCQTISEFVFKKGKS